MKKFMKTTFISFLIVCAIRFITLIFGVFPNIPYWPLFALGISIFCAIVAVTRGKVFIVVGILAAIAAVCGLVYLAIMFIGALFSSPYTITSIILLVIFFGGTGCTILVIIFD